MDGPGLVIFDCDGVLVDSEPIAMRVFMETLRAAGCEIDLATGYRRFLGRSLAACVEDLRRDPGLDLDAAALEGMRATLYAAFREGLTAIAGVTAALEDLAARGVPVCVASSSQPERVRLSLDLAGLARFFGEARIFSATMVARGKPAPDLFLHAAAAMNCPPARCLVVEDSTAGIRAARAAGMRVVGYAGGGHAAEAGLERAMTGVAPDAILTDMAGLAAHVAHWGG